MAVRLSTIRVSIGGRRRVRGPGLQGNTPWFIRIKTNGSWMGSTPEEGRAAGQLDARAVIPVLLR